MHLLRFRAARRIGESGSASVAVRICSKSDTDSDVSSTRIGKRPCSSGMRSEGFDRWNAPDAMNRMWSVLTMPYFVDTVVPSTSGRRSRCTPWRETSAPCISERRRDLVDLVQEHDAVLLGGGERLAP